MNRNDIKKFLSSLGAKVPYSQPRSGWIISSCPMAPWSHVGGVSSSEVFGVRIDPGECFCTCFSCGFHGLQSDLLFEMQVKNKFNHSADFPFQDLNAEIEKAAANVDFPGMSAPSLEEMLMSGVAPGPKPFPEWWLETFPPALDTPFAEKYLSQRDCSFTAVKALDVRADPNQHRVCFPVRDFHGVLMGMQGRSTLPDAELRYRMYTFTKLNNPVIWLGESWVDFSKPVIFAEGPFDLLSIYRVYRNVVSPLFANPNADKLKRMSDAMEILTFFDKGAGGDAGRDKVKSKMQTSVVEHIIPPGDYKDAGEMDLASIKATLEKYVTLDAIMIA